MSSGSDHEEFYDATDQSPSSPFDPGMVPRSVTLSQIEEEEKRLLLLKKRAEERRRQEDEELECRLFQLEQQKQAEIQTKTQDPDHLEHEGRRRKLEEMRQSLGTDHSFFSTSNDSSLENDSPIASVDIPDIFALSKTRPMMAPKSHTIEKMENSGDQNPSCYQHVKKRSGSWGDLPKADAGLTGSVTALAPAVDKGRVLHSPQSDDADLTGGEGRDRAGTTVSEGRRNVRNIELDSLASGELNREDKLSNLDQNMAKFQPDKEKQNKSLTLLISGSKIGSAELTTDSLVDRILEQTQVQEDSEPDIIKSTKSRTPPSTLKTPAAPPRRKRFRNNMQTSTLIPPSQVTELPPSVCEEQEPSSPLFIQQCPPSPNLGPKGKTNCLDVKSVLEGSRLIHTQVVDPEVKRKPSSQCDLTTSSSSNYEDFKDGSDVPGAVGSSWSGGTMDSNMDSLSMQIQNWQSLGDGGREASPNQRPRSSSGRLLSDEEILELVTVRNLDTGETMPLSTAEDKLPKCVNPLALHIMRRTKEYSRTLHCTWTTPSVLRSPPLDHTRRISAQCTNFIAPVRIPIDTSLHIDRMSDESDSRSEKSIASSSNNIRRKGVKIKKLFGKTVNKVKSVADQALHSNPPVEEEVSVDGKVFKIKSSSKNKGPYDFSQPNILQELSGDHIGAIWTMKFSPCGKLLATGGQDSILRIWVIKSTYDYFEDFRQKYGEVRLSPSVSHDSLNLASSTDASAASRDPLKELNKQDDDDETNTPFKKKPFCVYKGHTADLLDLSWSKNYFILSSSMDKTVRLWHISRRECLCTFQHIDFVTAIVFHPKDDRYFLSGSLDGKLRLWNIPDKKVTLWNELSGASNLITTANFCYNGRLAVVGTYDGKCIFYTTEQLKYYTMVNVRSSRGKNSRGRKITGIESMPGEEKILITSNDSRIRLYNLRDLTLTCKYKGCTNNSSQIRASFSPTGKYVVCGSEDHFLYVWKTNHEFIKFTSARRDRNDYWEAIKVHNAVVTAAVFAPNPSFIFRMAQQQNLEKGLQGSTDDDTEDREIIVSADFTGAIKVITNRPNCRSMFY